MKRPGILLFILRRCRPTSQEEEHLEGILGIWRLGAPGIPKRPVCSFIYRQCLRRSAVWRKTWGSGRAPQHCCWKWEDRGRSAFHFQLVYGSLTITPSGYLYVTPSEFFSLTFCNISHIHPLHLALLSQPLLRFLRHLSLASIVIWL